MKNPGDAQGSCVAGALELGLVGDAATPSNPCGGAYGTLGTLLYPNPPQLVSSESNWWRLRQETAHRLQWTLLHLESQCALLRLVGKEETHGVARFCCLQAVPQGGYEG